jgi:hypothetical protein
MAEKETEPKFLQKLQDRISNVKMLPKSELKLKEGVMEKERPAT